MSFIKSIKRHPVLSFFLVAVVLYQGYSIWQSKGVTLIIETPEPAEDIVVICEWYNESLLFGGHSTGNYRYSYKVFVTESGKKVDCGYSFFGERPSFSFKHPTLMGDGKENYEEDGVKHIVMNKTKLDLLEEQKAKFEAGYWDTHRNPGRSFLGSLPGCGFPHQYFDYYKQVRNINIDHFKVFYQKSILECLNKSYIETRKHDPYLAKKLPNPSVRINQLWESIKGEITK